MLYYRQITNLRGWKSKPHSILATSARIYGFTCPTWSEVGRRQKCRFDNSIPKLLGFLFFYGFQCFAFFFFFSFYYYGNFQIYTKVERNCIVHLPYPSAIYDNYKHRAICTCTPDHFFLSPAAPDTILCHLHYVSMYF